MGHNSVFGWVLQSASQTESAIAIGDTRTVSLAANQYYYCSFEVSDPNWTISIDAKPANSSTSSSSASAAAVGDPDLYISMDHAQPSHGRYTWRSQTAGPAHVELSQSDASFRPGVYHVGLRAYEPPSKRVAGPRSRVYTFDLSVTRGK